ncbi:6-bladed beta-propeller [Parabacteroides pacaensis]|uniref:6-bladed beta-propeller n=1 Tax=Parabacteroides pacaensis TaxID=2086575 RepID=UPI000D0EA4F2|nr:6-bladed beta-propeller [Parabacteroides pacaensis]
MMRFFLGKSKKIRDIKILILGGCILCGCSQFKRPSFEPQDITNVVKESVNEENTKVIKVQEPVEQIKASELIEEFVYLPLETSDESLFAYCNNLIFYKDHIYLLDHVTAEAVFIFDKQGKLEKKLGEKGGAPHEFAMLKGMAIDKNKDQLLLYDNRKRKMLYFTLDGEFIKSEKVNFRFCGQYGMLPSGNMVAATSKSDFNYHLNELTDYRLLYTDTVGLIKKTAYKYDDNEHLPLAYSEIFFCEDEMLYYPPFKNQICSVTDTVVNVKYQMDYDGFMPIDANRITEFGNDEDFGAYSSSTTWLKSAAENTKTLFFTTHNKRKNFYTFYDKKSGNMRSFTTLIFDTNVAFNLSPMYSYKDYFVGVANSELLISLRNYLVNNGCEIPENIASFLNQVKEDDNLALVMFKVKEL